MNNNSSASEIKHIEIEIISKDIDEKTVCSDSINEKNEEDKIPVTLNDLFYYADIKDKLYITCGLLTAIISGLNQPAQLIIFGSILDAFNNTTPEKSSKLVSFLAIMYLVVGFQQFCTNFSQTALMNMAAGRQIKKLRENYFKGLLRKDITFFDRSDPGTLATSVMERTLIVQDAIGEKLALAFQFVIAFLGGISVALYYCWALALLMFGIIPVLAGLIGIAISDLTKATTKSTEAYNIAGSTAIQALGSIRTIYSLAVEKKEADRYNEALTQAESAGLERWWATGGITGLIGMVMWLAYALGLWFGAYLISRDMENDPENCTYYTKNGNLHVPDTVKCVTGGHVMIPFFLFCLVD